MTNETNKKYRMLLIEDNTCDTQTIELRLKQAGLDFEYERVDSKSDIRKAVESRSWDVIICDYLLPGFNAEEVLDIVKPIDEDIPFIIVSGTVGEKTAVKLMKAGVHDYVMKDNLSRLAPAIQRELKEAEIRRTAKQTQKKQSPSPDHNPTLPLKEVERQHILRTIEDCNWVIEGNRGAANRLKVHPSTLRDRMRNLGIKRCQSRSEC